MGNGFNLSLKKAIRDGLIQGVHRIEIPNRLIAVAAAGAAVGFGVLPFGDLPAKRLKIDAIRANLSFQRMDTNLIATWSGNWGVGSAPTADNALAGTDVDIIASQAIGPANAAGLITGADVLVTTPITRTWTAAEELNLNMLVNAADITDSTTASIRVFGYVDFLMGMV